MRAEFVDGGKTEKSVQMLVLLHNYIPTYIQSAQAAMRLTKAVATEVA